MCGTNHTTRISRPVRPACPAPGSRRGRSVAEKRGSEPALPSQLSWVSGCSVPRRCQECRESLLTGTTVGRLLAALWRGSSALSCSRWEQHQPELCCCWLRGTHQVPDTRPSHQLSLGTFPLKLNQTGMEGQPNFLSSYNQLFSSSGKYGFGASNSHPNNIAEICTYLLWYVCMIPTS